MLGFDQVRKKSIRGSSRTPIWEAPQALPAKHREQREGRQGCPAFLDGGEDAHGDDDEGGDREDQMEMKKQKRKQ